MFIFRKKQNHTYAIVSDLKNKTSNSAIEMAPETKASSLEIHPTRDDIHDGYENEENTASKMSMKNILYEPGKFCVAHFIDSLMYTSQSSSYTHALN
jgi:hypothetical protein